MSFTRDDIELLSDRLIWDRKSAIIRKSTAKLKQTEELLIADSGGWNIPSELTLKKPKITKGENHQGYPFLVLDFPGKFDRDEVFAFRTLIWWGNFCSCTLHISGDRYRQLLENIILKSDNLNVHQFLVSRKDARWSNDMNDYMDFKSLQDPAAYMTEFFNKNGFIRVMRIMPLEAINQLEKFAAESAEKLFR